MLLAGVLRLVDQQMIDAEIELVMDPFGIDIREDRKRLVDQVVVIEQTAALFFLLVAREHCVRDRDQRRPPIAADHGAPTIQQCANAVLLRG